MRKFAFGDMAKLPQAAQLVVAVSRYRCASGAVSKEIQGILSDSSRPRVLSHRVEPGDYKHSLASLIIGDALFRRAGISIAARLSLTPLMMHRRISRS